jgi:hypothetical protein
MSGCWRSGRTYSRVAREAKRASGQKLLAGDALVGFAVSHSCANARMNGARAPDSQPALSIELEASVFFDFLAAGFAAGAFFATPFLAGV